MEVKRDENGVIMPIRTYSAEAEGVHPKKSFNAVVKSRDINAVANGGADDETDEAAAQGSAKAIGSEEIAKARSVLNDYIASKKSYDVRYKNNFDTYNLLYTDNDKPKKYKSEDGSIRNELIPKRMGGQTLNVIMNKHADLMDNFPEPVFLPRARDDEETAKILNSVMPCVLERNGFLQVYSEVNTDKLVGGTGAYAVVWNGKKDNGVGDVEICKADILSLFWEPFIEDIQDSRNVFYVRLYDLEEVKEMYPQLEDVSSSTMGLENYRTYDNSNKENGKAAVIDWYYKKNGVLHFVKFCGEKVLEATENEPEKYPNGLYNHGLYPFFLDPLFKLRDTPAGFSFVDICRSCQSNLDELKRDILKNIKVNSQTRSIINSNAGLNIADLNDLSKDFIEAQSVENATKPFETKDIAAGALNMYNALINEIKETTGTNDASNGAGSAGVTSGSAIAALQEAGGKISRDINKSGYHIFTEICSCIIELMRQFYTLPRFYRITGEDNKTEYIDFDNSQLMKQQTDESGQIFDRMPIFDIKVKAQKASPFATAASNEMMMDLYKLGFFNPQNADSALIALEGMSFEGKTKVEEMIKKNQTLEQTVQELYNKNQMMSEMLANKEAVNQNPMQARNNAVMNGGAAV